MSQVFGDRSRNLLLNGMDPDDYALIKDELSPTQLVFKDVIEHPGEPIDYVYFPEEGMLSIVSRFSSSRDVEVGVAGREGMSGGHMLLNDRFPTYATNVQVAGYAQRLHADVLSQAIAQSRRLHDFLLRFVRAAEIQTASTASANGRAKLEERLSRWLLMTHDRIIGDRLEVTHDLLSTMLACRRPGVTVTLHMLEGRGLIRSNRGHIIVLDRDGLEETANGSYGLAEAEYKRLLGHDFRLRGASRRLPTPATVGA
ncbi:Crp/Fnr family transcriptional regulator [uncultured Devosia sp.]|uniref:Crp/Fnr family transcriptional regulator n=1 Tax=uncultured Devosia sp. TaxID=211434 RepID=UPI0035CB4AAB